MFLVYFKNNFDVENYAQIQRITTFFIYVLHQQFKIEVAWELVIHSISMVVDVGYLDYSEISVLILHRHRYRHRQHQSLYHEGQRR